MEAIYFKKFQEHRDNIEGFVGSYNEIVLLDVRISRIYKREPFKREAQDEDAQEVLQYEYEYMLKGKKENGNWEIFHIWDKEDFFNYIDAFEIVNQT